MGELKKSPNDSKSWKTNQQVEVVLKVRYHKPADLLSDYLTSLGEGGLFINTTVPFEIGEHITFSISFPGFLEPQEYEGVVRWTRLPGKGISEEEAGLGVEFVLKSAEKKEQLQGLIRTLKDVPENAQVGKPTPFRVLLVEDNDIIQDLFAYAVRCFHHEHIKFGAPEILRASDGFEALNILKGPTVDLALIDHFLPAMTGSQLIRRIREIEGYENLPILVLSVGDEQIKRKALESGADLFLHKPVLNKHLVRTLYMLLLGVNP